MAWLDNKVTSSRVSNYFVPKLLSHEMIVKAVITPLIEQDTSVIHVHSTWQ